MLVRSWRLVRLDRIPDAMSCRLLALAQIIGTRDDPQWWISARCVAFGQPGIGGTLGVTDVFRWLDRR